MRKIVIVILVALFLAWGFQDMFIAERVSPVENWLMAHGFTDMAAVTIEFVGLALLLTAVFKLISHNPQKR